MSEQTHERPREIKEEIFKLAAVMAIVIVAGGLLYKFDPFGSKSATANGQTNQNNSPTMSPQKENFTITDPNLAIKPPTEEEIAKYDAEAEAKTVVMETTKGVIKLKLNPKDAPLTVASYMKLIDKGLYNGLTFHRVIDKFMIQGGDPSGNGMGGPGYKFVDELNPNTPSYKEGYKKGVLAMANSGPDTNGSQFFIMVDDYPLPNNYTIFGHVISGQDVADAISKVPTDKSNNMPLTPVKINKIYLE